MSLTLSLFALGDCIESPTNGNICSTRSEEGGALRQSYVRTIPRGPVHFRLYHLRLILLIHKFPKHIDDLKIYMLQI